MSRKRKPAALPTVLLALDEWIITQYSHGVELRRWSPPRPKGGRPKSGRENPAKAPPRLPADLSGEPGGWEARWPVAGYYVSTPSALRGVWRAEARAISAESVEALGAAYARAAERLAAQGRTA